MLVLLSPLSSGLCFEYFVNTTKQNTLEEDIVTITIMVSSMVLIMPDNNDDYHSDHDDDYGSNEVNNEKSRF